MASENLKVDGNFKPVIGLVTDNAAQEIRMARIDDTTKGLKVMIVGGIGTTQATTELWIDGNRTDTYTADGSITKPYKTISAAITGSVIGTYQGFTYHIAPATYVEASSIVFPNISTTINGNNASLVIQGGAGTVTFPSSFDCYSLNIVGSVLQTDTSITTIHNFNLGVIAGTLTVSGQTSLTDQVVTGAVTNNVGGILNVGFSNIQGVITNNGTLRFNSASLITTSTGYILICTTAGSVVYMAGAIIQNTGAGHGIDVRNGANGLPSFPVNEINTIDVILANATGVPVNAGIGAPNATTNGPSVTALSNYNGINNSGTVLYAVGSNYTASVTTAIDNTGTYKDSLHVPGTSGQVLTSTGTATAWATLAASGTVTNVSVSTANGVSGVVANPTTTPAITLTLGAITPTTVNKLTFTTPATGSTLTIIDGKTLTINKTISFTAADDTGVYTLPTGTKTLLATDGAGTSLTGIPYTLTGTANQVVLTGGTGNITFSLPQSIATSSNPQFATIELGAVSDTTLARVSAGVLSVEGVVIPSISSTNTLTNKRSTRRLTTTNNPGATPTTNTDNVDVMNFTGCANAITSMTTNLSGTPVDGDQLEFRFTDNGTARAITWGASFAATTVALPTTTVISTMLRVGFEWNGSLWQCIATA